MERTKFEKLHDLYSSPNIIRVIKSRKINGQGMCNVWGKERCLQGFGGKVWERDHSDDLDLARRIILKRIFKKWYGEGID
jgi:hypothetical protein